MKVYLLLLIFLSVVTITTAEEKVPEIGVYEKLDSQVPMDLEFTNSDGKKIKLSDIITKPTVLALVYYHCPGICSPLLTSLGEVVDLVELKPKEDFNVLTVSFDHNETPATAGRWKKNYLKAIKRNFPKDAWYFMTGDSVSVRRLADAVGFYYKPAGENDFTHAGSLIILTPEGKVSRYLFGTSYLPFDLKMAIIEASKGLSNPTINKMLQFCFSYDPEGKKYVFNFTKVIGSIMFLAISIFFTVLVVKGRNRKNKKEIV